MAVYDNHELDARKHNEIQDFLCSTGTHLRGNANWAIDLLYGRGRD